MTYGKTIEMFLVDGDADGIVTAELSNWNGKAIKIPRTEVADCERDDIRNVGVYFLFGNDQDVETAYIGESEDVLKRLKQHLNDNEYWTCAVAFTSSSLDKALIRYLEHELVDMAKECGRDKVLTQNTYETHLQESQKASMAEFIDNVKVLLSALNFRVLTPMPKPTEHTVTLFCGNSKSKDPNRHADGKGFMSPSGFTVMQGSQVAHEVVPSLKTKGRCYCKLRERLVADGTIVDDIFTRDYEFSSPSAASAVILGRTSNGNVDWKTKKGVKLGEME